MDQEVLVSSGQELVRLLDDTKIKPSAAMWIHYADTDTWKLWIVPSGQEIDKREFYRSVAEVISNNRDLLHGIDVSSVELVSASHPAMKGMKNFLHMPGIGSAHLSGNTWNGFFLPEGIAIRVNL
jgi:hypothetical protein